MLTRPLGGYEQLGHNCWSEASVTDRPAGSAPTTSDVLASQLQLSAGERELSDMHAGRVQQ